MSHLPQPPFRMIVCGPSMSGKTRFLVNTLKDIKKFDNVVIMAPRQSATQNDYVDLGKFYGEDKMLIQIGFPDPLMTEHIFAQLEIGKEAKQTTLFIIDDLMEEAKKSQFLSNLVTAACHHLGISIVLIQQTLMLANIGRTARLNSDYIVVFPMHMDKRAFNVMAQQMEPNEWPHLVKKFEEVTSKPYTPFIIDIKSRRENRPAEFFFRDGTWGVGIKFPWKKSASDNIKTKNRHRDVSPVSSDQEVEDDS